MGSTSAFSASGSFSDTFTLAQNQEEQKDNNYATLRITINSSMVVNLKDVPKVGQLEIMSILGKRVTTKNLKDCAEGVYVDLPNGIYVIKAGKVSQKIAIRN